MENYGRRLLHLGCHSLDGQKRQAPFLIVGMGVILGRENLETLANYRMAS